MGGTVSGCVQLTRHDERAIVATRLTPEKREAFLQRLELTGNISEASDTVGISRMAAFELRNADPDFDAAIIDVMERVTDRLERKIRERAENGTAKGVWYRGERCGEEIEHHDVLAMFMLKGARPDMYRENQGVQVNVGLSIPAVSKCSDADLEYLVAQRLRTEHAISPATFNVIKEEHNNSRLLDNSAHDDVEQSNVVQRSAVQGAKGPNRSRRGGGVVTTRPEGDPKERHDRAKKSKSRKRSAK